MTTGPDPDNEMRQQVAVVIPARNEAERIARQLHALALQTHRGAYEVIVADNGSTDDTPGVVSRFAQRHPFVRLVDASARRGINAARNAGVVATDADLILFCDADDWVEPDWVERMVNGLAAFDIVGGVLDFRKANTVELSTAQGTERGPLIDSFDFRSCIGANMAFHRRVWENVGGFDEQYICGFDEVDFCIRAQLAGFTVGAAPDARVNYRLRDGLRETFRQARSYGRGSAQMRAKLAPAVPPLSIRRELSALKTASASLARSLYRRRDPRGDVAYIGLVVGVLATMKSDLRRHWRW